MLIWLNQAIFHYKQSTYYNRKIQFTVKWDDPRLKIVWPIKNLFFLKEINKYDYM